ncbi:MAG: uroporphyrinogen-III C-methyltransferase [Syntrophus sp. (in: bacteria)]|nr:uroporphyrinogen-III C-methyltransferase [Syntrophus sp. (in: bacteria)]
MGRVYLVGAGPGDPKLITVRGLELIRKADSIIYDYLANTSLLGYARKDAELVYVGKQASRHALSQDKINTLLVQKAHEREVVVRLKGGDPFIFGRGGEEAAFLVENGIDFEIIPGITSAIAVPAYAGIPLTHRGYASSAAFITGHEDEGKANSAIKWHELANGVDTLVFLMGIKNLEEIKTRLIKEGRDPQTHACVIQWGTLSRQKVVTGSLQEIDFLAQQAGIEPPGIILVGDVVALREKLRWFEKRPLFGKKVAVTRAPHQSMKLGELLSEKGADVIYIQTIEVTTIEPNKKLSEAIERIKEYYCIIFTSVNGVSVFFDSLFENGKDTRALGGAKVLPIGTATAALLKSRGIVPDFMPEYFTSEGIIGVLEKMEIKGRKFLLPRAEDARDVIVKYIKEQGGQCDVIPVYRTTLPENPVSLIEKPDIITFTSSSTVTNFITLYGKDVLENACIASIGPITSETLEQYQIKADIEASQYDIDGLVDAIVRYTNKN